VEDIKIKIADLVIKKHKLACERHTLRKVVHKIHLEHGKDWCDEDREVNSLGWSMSSCQTEIRKLCKELMKLEAEFKAL
jgi:hypothetical protein